MGVVDAAVVETCVGAGTDEVARVGSIFEDAMCAEIGTLEVASV